MKTPTEYLAIIGRNGGKSRSQAKREASRKNGMFGGRPKMNQRRLRHIRKRAKANQKD